MRVRMMIPLAISLLAITGCEGDNAFSFNGGGGGGTGVVPTSSARVRFVNALSGVDGNLLLTSNGTLVGSQQAFGATGTCTTVGAGANRRLVFGDANASGTAIADSIASLTTSLESGGNYTIVAIGTLENPRLIVLDNNATTPASGNANVRLINATDTPIDFFATAAGATLGTPLNGNISASSAGVFAAIPVTNTSLTFRTAGSTTPIFTSTGTFNAGQSYNVVLLPNATNTGFQAVTFARC